MADDPRTRETSAASSRRESLSNSYRHDSTASQQQSQSSSAQFMTSSQLSELTPRPRRPYPTQTFTESYGAINTTPTPANRNRRPGPSRRSTSTHVPRRGEEFSVDDDQDEIGKDREVERQRQRQAKLAETRRQPSTLRRRPTAQAPSLPRLESATEEEVEEEPPIAQPADGETPSSGEEGTIAVDDAADDDAEEEDEADLSDAESFTLRDRQEAINVTHPFGIRIWKPALYKKGRSVQKTAEEDIHSSPGLHVSAWLVFFNILWTLLFGWWLAIICLLGAAIELCCSCVSEEAWYYAVLLKGLARYLFYPFGQFVKLVQDEDYADEDAGEGRSISEYEQWQAGDIEEGRLFFGPVRSLIGRSRRSLDSADETQSLLGRPSRNDHHSEPATGAPKRRLFGRGKWNFGRVIFYIFFYAIVTIPLFIVSGICWLLVFTIPMGRVTILLFHHLRRHPLALSFHSGAHDVRNTGDAPSSILLCTYRAVGIKYWKYTIDGTNIFLINLLALVVFTIFDFYVLREALAMRNAFTSQGAIFALALVAIIPLAYFIGQAVASISAQSSMGLGATINAFFSTIVEVFLYCVALNQGKAQLVEGSIIGSIFAGILFLPGISMCFGALKRKTQRFNVKSAGVTSTMLLFAVIAAFGPTLFYQIYGSHELKCRQCHRSELGHSAERDCRRCFFSQTPAVHDRFYTQAVLPYIYFSAMMLFLSYLTGLLFTLRTHAAVIWSSDLDEKKGLETMAASTVAPMPAMDMSHHISHPHEHLTRANTAASTGLGRTDIRESQLYQRILGQSLRQVGVNDGEASKGADKASLKSLKSPHIVPPKSRDADVPSGFHLKGLSDQDNTALTRQVAEIAATAAAVAARDATKAPRRALSMALTPGKTAGEPHRTHSSMHHHSNHAAEGIEHGGHAETTDAAGGGHDAPNWSRTKSAVILMTATIAYAVIAEILVNTVDSVLEHVDIDEKFLGITLFALVPNTTEFLNAISFAMNGNIALSMEIGSAYALQVCLLQIPALVLYSAVWGRYINPSDIRDHTFTLIFPQWDMVTVILCVFLLSYMYGEGKSNYFKGSILILSYLVVVVGFWFASYDAGEVDGIDTGDTLAFLSGNAWKAMKTNGFMVGE